MRSISGLLVFACIGLVVVAGKAQEPQGKLPPDTWKLLWSGKRVAYTAPLIWLPDQRQAFLWPTLEYRSSAANFEQFRTLHLFDVAAEKWNDTPSAFPPEGNLEPYGADRPYLYLPGIKKVLVLAPQRRKRTAAPVEPAA